MQDGSLVLIGIGQSLRGDDGAGTSAVQAWQQAYAIRSHRAVLRVELVELPGVALLDILLPASSAVLVDAVSSGAVPGSLHTLTETDLAAFSPGSSSAHGLGVAETLALGRRLYPEQMPAQIVLIGIEVGSLASGPGLSPMVVAALPAAVRAIDDALTRLGLA